MCSYCGCDDDIETQSDDGLDTYRQAALQQEADDRTDWDNDDSPTEK